MCVLRRGPVRYKFEVLYPLDQVLPVNIKDRGNTKNAFKVLIFPDTRVFMASTAKSKVSQHCFILYCCSLPHLLPKVAAVTNPTVDVNSMIILH